MADIVTRLRKLVATDDSRHLKDGAMLLAADEIGRLRAAGDDLREWVEHGPNCTGCSCGLNDCIDAWQEARRG